MMSSVFIKTTKSISAAIFGVLLYIFNEGLIIFFVHTIGPWWTTLLYTTVFGFLSILLFQGFLNAAQAKNWVGRLVRWFIEQAAAWKKKYTRLFETSGVLAIATAALLAGSFVSAILTGILGYTGRKARVMIMAEALFSALFWSMFYAGLLKLFFH